MTKQEWAQKTHALQRQMAAAMKKAGPRTKKVAGTLAWGRYDNELGVSPSKDSYLLAHGYLAAARVLLLNAARELDEDWLPFGSDFFIDEHGKHI